MDYHDSRFGETRTADDDWIGPRYSSEMRRLTVGILLTALAVGVPTFATSDDHQFCARYSRKSQFFGAVYSKTEQRLCVFRDGAIIVDVPASHGRAPGAKVCEGDARTPEGDYTVTPARDSAQFGKFMHVSYPNAEDRRVAEKSNCEPGGAIGIHGPQAWYAWLGPAHALLNHSDGCIVLDRESMALVSRAIRQPIPMRILP